MNRPMRTTNFFTSLPVCATIILTICSSVIFLSFYFGSSTLTITPTTTITTEEKQERNYYNNIFNHIAAFAQKDEDSSSKNPIIKNSRILDFAGSNYADVVNSNEINLNSFTVSVWFNTEMNVTGRDVAFLVNKGGFGTEREGFNLNYGLWLDNRERVTGGFETLTGDDFFINSQAPYADGLWHNAILTFDEKLHLLNLYIDGLEVATNSTLVGITPDNTGNQSVRLGANSFEDKGPINGNYTGQLDDIQVWDFAFTKPQVTSLFETESKMTR
ncbi:MAG: LamG domain-containing protein [Nitrososphaeraceae archaeon]